MPRFFLVYADGKKVRELSWTEYYRLVQRGCCLLVSVDEYGVGFLKGHKAVWIALPQLQQILDAAKNRTV